MVADVLMERMTSPRIRQAIAAGADSSLIMLGSTEQHGPHLPISSDALISQWVGVRIATRLGNTLMAPVIRPGCSDHHMAFAGTISMSGETLKSVLRDYTACLVKQGFKKIIIITVHGGNMPPMVELAPELAHKYPEVEIHVMTRAEPMLESVWAVCDRRGINRLAGGAHAGEVETSMLLAGAPELTDLDHAQPGLLAEYSAYAARAHAEGLQAVSPNGVLGDPTDASPDAGYDYLLALAEHHVREFREGHMRIQP